MGASAEFWSFVVGNYLQADLHLNLLMVVQVLAHMAELNPKGWGNTWPVRLGSCCYWGWGKYASRRGCLPPHGCNIWKSSSSACVHLPLGHS